MCTAHSSTHAPNRRVGSRQTNHVIHMHKGSGMVTMVQGERCSTSSPTPCVIHSTLTARHLPIPVFLICHSKLWAVGLQHSAIAYNICCTALLLAAICTASTNYARLHAVDKLLPGDTVCRDLTSKDFACIQPRSVQPNFIGLCRHCLYNR